ncbi:MAG TPA: PD-(D/E)XK nuclease family protein, partial [Hyphomicrobiaceae bacterium]|nr:PD-(D/E)XK nuclease family protein [Hyphomicrobiaceae bacterium]
LAQAHPAAPLETWARTAAPREPQLTMPLAPSRLAPYDVDEAGEPITPPPSERSKADEPPATRPLVRTTGNRFLRGTLTHTLLQHLPSIPKERWDKTAAAFVERRGHELAPAVRRSIVRETLAILTSPEFAPLFGPQSQAEVAIAAEIPRPDGRGPALKLNGQIDRLAVEADTVYVIDYKTNRPPPREASQVADAYLLQLAAYRLALAQMFPQKAMKGAILWTDGPRLMEISDATLITYERKLWDLGTTNLDVP